MSHFFNSMQSIARWELATNWLLSIPQIIYCLFSFCISKASKHWNSSSICYKRNCLQKDQRKRRVEDIQFLPSNHFVQEAEERVAAAHGARATGWSDSRPASSLKAHLPVDVPSDQKIAVTDTSDRNEFPLSGVRGQTAVTGWRVQESEGELRGVPLCFYF